MALSILKRNITGRILIYLLYVESVYLQVQNEGTNYACQLA